MDLTRMGIKVLNQLFFGEKADEWLGIASLELQYEVGIFRDLDTTAMMIYQERAFDLVDKFDLVDHKLANDLRKWLNMK